MHMHSLIHTCNVQGSGCRVLLVNDMSEDLSRMFR